MHNQTTRCIESASNQLFKDLKSLATGKGRKRQQRFILEGWRYIKTSPVVPEMLIVRDDLDPARFSRSAAGENIILLEKSLFAGLTDTENSQGVLAVYKIPEAGRYTLPDQTDLALVLDGVQDPGNTGTIIRTADAAGVKNIFLTEKCADPYSPKSVRSSAGSVLALNIIRGSETQILDMLGQAEYKIITASPGAQVDHIQIPHIAAKYKKLALVVGSEAHGIGSLFEEASDIQTKIEIKGTAESLNVAVAAGILLYKIQEGR